MLVLQRSFVEDDKAYVAALKAHQIAARSLDLSSHHYSSAITAEAAAGGARVPRVMKELRALRTALPLNFGSSVFLRYDKARPYVLQVTIAL